MAWNGVTKKLKNNTLTIVLPGLLTTLFFSRFLPHPPNFTAVMAVSLFSGLYLPPKKAFLIPLIGLLATDLILGFYNPWIMFSVYLGFCAPILAGRRLKQNLQWKNLVAIAALSSTVFFLITNLAVWKFGFLYQHSFAGLIQCYIAALPFFGNSILGDIFYSSLFYAVFVLYKKRHSLKTMAN